MEQLGWKRISTLARVKNNILYCRMQEGIFVQWSKRNFSAMERRKCWGQVRLTRRKVDLVGIYTTVSHNILLDTPQQLRQLCAIWVCWIIV